MKPPTKQKPNTNTANDLNVGIVLDSTSTRLAEEVGMNHCIKLNKLASFQYQITTCILGILEEICLFFFFFSMISIKPVSQVVCKGKFTLFKNGEKESTE